MEGFRRLLCTLLSAFVISSGSPSCAQSLSPYSDFQAMTTAEIMTLQVKLTPIDAPNTHRLPLVFITSFANEPNVSAFTPFYRDTLGVFYDRDKGPYEVARAAPEQLKAIIDSVGTVPAITAGGVTYPCWSSFALFNSTTENKVFEAILNQQQTGVLLGRLRAALKNNSDALLLLAAYACALGVPDPVRPTEVTSQVRVSLSGFLLDRTTGYFVTQATVLNTSQTIIEGPLSVVFFPHEAGFFLQNRTAPTCVLGDGQGYVNLPVTSLAPQQSSSVRLEFDNPDELEIRVTTRVYAGAGAR